MPRLKEFTPFWAARSGCGGQVDHRLCWARLKNGVGSASWRTPSAIFDGPVRSALESCLLRAGMLTGFLRSCQKPFWLDGDTSLYLLARRASFFRTKYQMTGSPHSIGTVELARSMMGYSAVAIVLVCLTVKVESVQTKLFARLGRNSSDFGRSYFRTSDYLAPLDSVAASAEMSL